MYTCIEKHKSVLYLLNGHIQNVTKIVHYCSDYLLVLEILLSWILESWRVAGPSYTVDSACSSSLYALEHAYKSIRDGHCTAAIVGGCNLCLHPYVSLQFSRLGVLSPQGMCKSFDRDGEYSSCSCNLL